MVIRRSLVVAFVFFLLFDSTFEQQIQAPAEKSALLELRSSLGLKSKDWPIKLDPCLNWTGIVCANGSVVGVNISGLKRTRLGRQNPQFAVDSLANLTNLVSFNASGFLLPGSIPDWFGSSLLNLQVLDLRSCAVNGVIPWGVGNLTSLTGLYLSDNSITGEIPLSLGQLWNLLILDLSRNSLTGSIPSSFASLGNLTSLDISSNYLSGSIPPGIGSLLKLQSLNLSSNSLISSIPGQLGNLSSLVDLDLSFNGLSGSVPEDLRGLRSLQRMLFGHNALGGSLSDNLFQSTSQSQVVVLRQNSFTGAVPDVLWSLPGLSLLDVSGNNFTGPLPNSSLTSNDVSASVLNISSNMFYGDLTPLLGNYSSVDLSGNYFEGKIPAYLPNNASLGSNCLQNMSNQRNSTVCSTFYAEKGLVFDNFGLPNSTQSPKTGSRKSRVKLIILVVVLGAVALLALVVALLLLVRCTCKKDTVNQRAVEAQSVSVRDSPPPAGATTINFSKLGDAFTYEQLLQATLDFSDENLIKNGHSGVLFKGLMAGGIPVVIKRIDLQSIKADSYMIELEFFRKASHTRLVPLLGHCLEKEDEKFLVYKYMPNADLSSSLFREGDTGDDDIRSLDWITRLKIAIGAAEGLSYLHHECSPPFVHRDVQASSILLDDKYEVRLGSLSEVGPQEGDGHQSRIGRLLRLPQPSEQGTSGSPTASCSYDVYCFGKVLLELVTGKLGISASNDAQVKEWLDQTLPFITIYDKELVTKIVDPSLIVDEDLLEEVWAMSIVARSCLNPKPSRRPLMRYILKALENPLKVVREENSSSARLRTTSSRGSWNSAVFSSWRSTSDLAVIPAASSAKEGPDSSKLHSGTSNSYSAEHSSSSRRRHSREICPEPPGMMQDVERQEQEHQRD